jgi:hypothetical protein
MRSWYVKVGLLDESLADSGGRSGPHGNAASAATTGSDEGSVSVCLGRWAVTCSLARYAFDPVLVLTKRVKNRPQWPVQWGLTFSRLGTGGFVMPSVQASD